MSEYGFQSFPELPSVARYATPADYDIESPVMLSHQRHPRGNPLVRTYMDRDFRKPKDFASFLYVSQVLQATVISYAAEAHRRRMPYNQGSLYWQLDDCWPVASWAGIDYFGRWKALHYAARRFFAPILLSTVEEGGELRVYGVSDSRTPTRGHLTLRLVDFEGRELWRKTSDVTLAANASTVLSTWPRASALQGANPVHVVLVADLEPMHGDRLARSLFYFEKTKDLVLPDPELSVEVTPHTSGVGASVRVTARAAGACGATGSRPGAGAQRGDVLGQLLRRLARRGGHRPVERPGTAREGDVDSGHVLGDATSRGAATISQASCRLVSLSRSCRLQRHPRMRSWRRRSWRSRSSRGSRSATDGRSVEGPHWEKGKESAIEDSVDPTWPLAPPAGRAVFEACGRLSGRGIRWSVRRRGEDQDHQIAERQRRCACAWQALRRFDRGHLPIERRRAHRPCSHHQSARRSSAPAGVGSAWRLDVDATPISASLGSTLAEVYFILGRPSFRIATTAFGSRSCVSCSVASALSGE